MPKPTKHVRFEDDVNNINQPGEPPLTEEEQLRAKVRTISYDAASPFSQFFLQWLSPLVKLGKKYNIKPEDVPTGPYRSLSAYTVPILYSAWQRSVTALQHQLTLIHSEVIAKIDNNPMHTPATGISVFTASELSNLPHPLPLTQYTIPEYHQTIAANDNNTNSFIEHDFKKNRALDATIHNHFEHHPAITLLNTINDNNAIPDDIIAASLDRKDNTTDISTTGPEKGEINTQIKTTKPVENDFSVNNFTHLNPILSIKQPEPRGLLVLMQAFQSPLIWAALGEVMFCAGQMAQPYGIKLLSRYFNRYRNDPTSVSTIDGILCAFVVAILSLYTCTTVVFKQNSQIDFASRCVTSNLSSVFAKMLKIAPYSISSDPTLSTGTMTNLTSQDSMQPFGSMMLMNQIWSGPIMLCIISALMFFDFGMAALVCFVMMIILIPYQVFTAKITQYYRKITMEKSDQRVKFTLSVLQGLRVAKLYAWTPALQDKLQEYRNIELRALRVVAFLQSFSDIFTYIYPLIVTYVTLAVYVRQSDNVDFSPSQVVVLIAYLNSLRHPIQFLGQSIQAMVDLNIASQRISHFLSKQELPVHQHAIEAGMIEHEIAEEQKRQLATQGIQNDNRHIGPFRSNLELSPTNTTTIVLPDSNDEPIVKVTNCDFYFSSFDQKPLQSPVLTNISFEIKRGEMFGVISESGVGKTALLTGILGELYPLPYKQHTDLTSIVNFPYISDGLFSFNNSISVIPSSLINLKGKAAYCSQQPWLMNDTVRNNIILNLPFNQQKFLLVIEAAALGSDLEIFVDGDLTLVSEGGASLSGGQKSRIDFARLLYHANEIDIVVLDDIFSAVDAYVAKTMFFKGILGILKDKAILMSLNSHYDFLQHCSKVVVLDYCHDPYWFTLHQYILNHQSSVLYQQQNRINNKNTGEGIKDALLPRNYTSSGDSSDDMSTYIDDLGRSQHNNPPQTQHLAQQFLNNQSNLIDYFEVDPSLLQTSPSALQYYIQKSSTLPYTSQSNLPVNIQQPYNNSNINSNHVNFQTQLPPPTPTCGTGNVVQGFRQPASISFMGSLTDLISMNLPLLSQFTLSTHTESDLAMTAQLGTQLLSSKIAAHNETKEAEQAAKLEQKVENNEQKNKDGAKQGGSPSQASVPFSIYTTYFQGSRTRTGLWIVLGAFLFVTLLSQAVRTFSDVWLVKWADDEALGPIREHSRTFWLQTTAYGMIAAFLLYLAQVLIFLYVSIDGSRFIHATAVSRVMNSTMGWLDQTAMGNILNKIAGKDIEILDNTLPDNLLYVIQQVLILLGIITLSVITAWWFIIPLLPLACLLLYLRKGFHNASVSLKRIESAALAPIYSLFTGVVRGAPSIRAYGLQKHFIAQHRKLIDKFVSVRITNSHLERRFGYHLNIIASAYVFFIASAIVLARDYIDTGLGLLACTYSLRLVGLLQMTIRFYTQTTQAATSIHRIELLAEAPQEPPFRTTPEIRQAIDAIQPVQFKTYTPPPQLPLTTQQKHKRDLFYWPWRGAITFQNVSARYRPELPIVINRVSLTIEPGAKVGIVGKTGAGKSTALSLLFRMIDPCEGEILIDGVSIKALGLGDLRSRIAIIPQTPTLFSGTIRSNLDPLEQFTDEMLWEALRWVDLQTKVQQMSDDGLNTIIDEGGTNLSASEKQLLCIARALVTQNQSNSGASINPRLLPPPSGSIVVSDEMTASLPNDEMINNTIRNAFSKSTFLIIAHRLQTIITCDKILVLRPLTEQDVANGVSSIAEYDIPYLLLNNQSSLFYTMAMNTGEENFAVLYNMAKESYFNRFISPSQTTTLSNLGENNGYSLTPNNLTSMNLNGIDDEGNSTDQVVYDIDIDPFAPEGATHKKKYYSHRYHDSPTVSTIQEAEYEASFTNVNELLQSTSRLSTTKVADHQISVSYSNSQSDSFDPHSPHHQSMLLPTVIHHSNSHHYPSEHDEYIKNSIKSISSNNMNINVQQFQENEQTLAFEAQLLSPDPYAPQMTVFGSPVIPVHQHFDDNSNIFATNQHLHYYGEISDTNNDTGDYHDDHGDYHYDHGDYSDHHELE